MFNRAIPKLPGHKANVIDWEKEKKRRARFTVGLGFHRRVPEFFCPVQLFLVALDGVRVVAQGHVDAGQVAVSPTLSADVARLLPERQLLRVAAQGLVLVAHVPMGDGQGGVGRGFHVLLAHLLGQLQLLLVNVDGLFRLVRLQHQIANVAQGSEFAHGVLGDVRDGQEVALALQGRLHAAQGQMGQA